jgi:hypothetical protein
MSVFPPLAPSGCAAGPLYGTGWDRGALGGILVPGRCRVVMGCIKVKRDKKSKKGADGSNPTQSGIDPQPIELEVTMWTDAHLAEFKKLCDQLLPQAGVKRKPVSLDHPDLYHLGSIVNVEVLGASALMRQGRTRICKLQLHHWMPSTSKGGKDATSTPTRAVRNARREQAEKRNPPNPPPTLQSGFGSPPFSSNQ